MDGDLLLYPLWPQPKREMLLGVVFPGSATAPHYLSIGQLADFITAGGITLPLPISDGGTGQATAPEALTALGGAPIVDAHLLGLPTAPTPAAGDSSTRIATTAFVISTAGAPSWDNITDKPASFPPTLPIPQSGVVNLESDLAATAPLASPVFTGNPQAPTPSPGDADTSIATTAFVAAALSALPPSGSTVTVSDTAPATPAPGDLWFDSLSANLFVRYADADTTQWVIATNQPGPQGPAGQTWTVGSGLTLSANTISLTTPALPLAGGTLTGTLSVGSNATPILAKESGYTVLYSADGTAMTGAIMLGASADPAIYYRNAQHHFQPRGGGASYCDIDGNGINLTSYQINFAGAAGGTTGAGPYFYADTSNTILKIGSSGGGLFVRNTDGVDKFVFVCGDGTAQKTGGGSWATLSDIRLKRNVCEYETGLQAVLQLNPIEYEYNGKGGTVADGRRYVGLMAGDAIKAMPELVDTVKGKLDPDDEHEIDIQRLDPSALVYALVNAVKELSARLAELEAAK